MIELGRSFKYLRVKDKVYRHGQVFLQLPVSTKTRVSIKREFREEAWMDFEDKVTRSTLCARKLRFFLLMIDRRWHLNDRQNAKHLNEKINNGPRETPSNGCILTHLSMRGTDSFTTSVCVDFVFGRDC